MFSIQYGQNDFKILAFNVWIGNLIPVSVFWKIFLEGEKYNQFLAYVNSNDIKFNFRLLRDDKRTLRFLKEFGLHINPVFDRDKDSLFVYKNCRIDIIPQSQFQIQEYCCYYILTPKKGFDKNCVPQVSLYDEDNNEIETWIWDKQKKWFRMFNKL